MSEEKDDMAEAIAAMGPHGLVVDPTLFVDSIEAKLSTLPPKECPLDHIFTPGLYTRIIQMDAGTLLTSKIHNTEHPFVILKGSVMCWTKELGVQTIAAPYIGVTKPGTRRILFIVEDTVWATFHPTTLTDLKEIEDLIIKKHENPLIEEANSQKEICLPQ